jgi:hypothetical protein
MEKEVKYNGDSIIDDQGVIYPINKNYASKSRLIDGDVLIMRTDSQGGIYYKLSKPVPRKTVIADIKETNGQYIAIYNNKSYKILTAASNFYELYNNCQAMIVISITEDNKWCAIDGKVTK